MGTKENLESTIKRLDLNVTILAGRMRDYINNYKGRRIDVAELQVMLSEYSDNAYALDTLLDIAMVSFKE